MVFSVSLIGDASIPGENNCWDAQYHTYKYFPKENNKTILWKEGANKLNYFQSEVRKRLEQGIMLMYLLQLNRYALENELITNDIYRKMEVSIRQKYGSNFA